MSNNASSISSSLPLDWTQISRRKRKSVTSSQDEEITFFCCDDPTCERDSGSHNNNSSATSYDTKTDRSTSQLETSETENGNKNTKNETAEKTSSMATLSGKAIFCLHSLDCKWFQGHFVPSRMNSSSFGLLAVERDDIDDCLQCKDGGYREIDLTILSASKKWEKKTHDETIHASKDRKKLKVDKLRCTGGDMLRITTPAFEYDDGDKISKNDDIQITFDAEKIIIGVKVQPIVQRYFPTLLPELSMNESFSDLLPDCAIVTGDMCIRVPTDFVYDRDATPIADNIDDWME